MILATLTFPIGRSECCFAQSFFHFSSPAFMESLQPQTTTLTPSSPSESSASDTGTCSQLEIHMPGRRLACTARTRVSAAVRLRMSF